MSTNTPAANDPRPCRTSPEPLGGVPEAKPAFDLAIKAALLTDARRAELNLDSDCCLPSRESLSRAATL